MGARALRLLSAIAVGNSLSHRPYNLPQTGVSLVSSLIGALLLRHVVFGVDETMQCQRWCSRVLDLPRETASPLTRERSPADPISSSMLEEAYAMMMVCRYRVRGYRGMRVVLARLESEVGWCGSVAEMRPYPRGPSWMTQQRSAVMF